MKRATLVLLGFLASCASTAPSEEVSLPRVLFLTHSAKSVHAVVKRPQPDVLSLAEEAVIEAAAGRFDILASQDCALLEPDSLATFDAVLSYSSGELPVAAGVREALIDWVTGGGAFVGVHAASTCFYELPLYGEMIGGIFDGHPWHEAVGVLVERPEHPACAALGRSFTISDEIYQHRAFRRHPNEVLLTLDTTSVDASLGKRADGDYALAWCKPFGEGRVLYTAFGHEEEVWRDERFLAHLLDGIGWAIDGPDLPARAPEGATMLWDGSGTGAWVHGGGAQEVGWRRDGEALEVVAGTGNLVTRASFGDALIHVEFRTPEHPPEVRGQARGNSGVYVQGRYEVQVLDSFGLEPKIDDCAAIYGVRVPDRNASRPPLRWQSYDIRFRAPRFDAQGAKTESARMSVWHNGVPVHLDVEVPQPTRAAMFGTEQPRGPLLLQDHGNPVQYRNVWILPLASNESP
jgi:type 1 glutamine amidotransferase